MQRREKNLILSLAGIVGLFLAVGFVESRVFGPINTLDGQIDLLTTNLQDAQKSKLEVLAATAQLAQARRASLPPDSSAARVLYQRWLTDLAVQSCGLANFKLNLEGIQGDGKPFVRIPMHFTADATYEQAVQFLKRFGEVDLLHHISKFDLAPAPAAAERFRLTVTIEALTLPSAAPRATLFPETTLSAAVSAQETQLPVNSTKGFPLKAPFRIRSASEWMEVTNISKDGWTVRRGLDSPAAEHAVGAVIELVPLRTGPVDAKFEEAVATLKEVNPFRKPGPIIEYKPRVTPSGTQEVVRGKPLALTVGVQSWNPAWGAPRFVTVGEPPAGLTLDPQSGELKWSPAAEIEPGEYPLQIAAESTLASDQRVTTDLTLKLRNPNEPPRFNEIDAPKAYLGRPLSLRVTAEDPDKRDRLRYRLVGKPPAGMSIDDRSGRLSWTPSEDLAPGNYNVDVTVTDNGEPPLTATKTLTIKAEDDAARFTSLRTIFAVDGVKQARFYNAVVNKVTAAKVGEAFEFADIKGTLLEVGPDYIVFESEGRPMRLGLGDAVRDMKPTDAPIAAPAAEPAEKDAPPGEAAVIAPATG